MLTRKRHLLSDPRKPATSDFVSPDIGPVDRLKPEASGGGTMNGASKRF